MSEKKDKDVEDISPFVREDAYESVAKVKLACFEALPAGKPRAMVFYFHGYASFTLQEYIRAMAKRFTDAGLAVYAFDQLGHGASPGRRVGFDHWTTLTDDAKGFVISKLKAIPDLPFFLYGESMGGAIAIITGLALQGTEFLPRFRSLLLEAPMCGQKQRPIPPLLCILRCCCEPLCPHCYSPIPLPPETCSRDKEFVKRYRKSKYFFKHNTRYHTGLELVRMTDFLFFHAKEIKVPLLLLTAQHDLIVTAHPEFLATVSTPKELVRHEIIKDAYHMILTDPSAPQAIQVVFEWVDKMLQPAAEVKKE